MKQFLKLVPIFGTLVLGTVLAVANKALYQLQAPGLAGDVHFFHKPWFLTAVMFCCMCLCLPCHHILQCCKKWHHLSTTRASRKALVLDNDLIVSAGLKHPSLDGDDSLSHSSSDSQSYTQAMVVAATIVVVPGGLNTDNLDDPATNSKCDAAVSLDISHLKGCCTTESSIAPSYSNCTKSEFNMAVQPSKPFSQWAKERALLVLPASFDMMATGLAFAGLVYTSASTYQMLRGAEILFVALLAVTVLKRKLKLMNWGGIAVCLAGVVLVGVASVLAKPAHSKTNAGNEESQMQPSTGQAALGVALIIAAQAIAAMQLTAEEYCMGDLDMPALEVVGWEGVWGMALSAIWLAVLQQLPSGFVFYENSLDTLEMLRNSPTIVNAVLINAAAFLGYNVCGMMVIGSMGSVFRTLLDTLRTLLIWVVGLAAFYSAVNIGVAGEQWIGPWSYMQVAGFVLLAVSALVEANTANLEVYFSERFAVPVWSADGHNLPRAGAVRRLSSFIVATAHSFRSSARQSVANLAKIVAMEAKQGAADCSSVKDSTLPV